MAESDSGPEGADVECRPRPSKRSRLGKLVLDGERGVAAGTGSVCKLFVKKVLANFSDPWRRHSQQTSTGTGFLVDGRWIVTNAHVVHRSVSVLVRATSGPPVKYSAQVIAKGLPCDLAVLRVDGDFWQGKESLELSDALPALDDNVTCIGFPVGGENISVTRGVVSRIDVNGDGLLRIQIDAAINPGNSGGPVLGSHGRVVGVAASHLKNASNIGYIIPTAVLRQFLECVESSEGYIGVASLGLGRVQTLESHVLRRKLGLVDGFTGGVRIPAIWPLGPSLGCLHVDDVLVSIDDIEIGQDATVPLRNNERIHFLHLVTRRRAGRDKSKVKVLRDGKEIEVDIPLRPDKWLVPRLDGYDAAPEYYIVGGLVFVPLSQPWTELKSQDRGARVLWSQHWGSALPEDGQQIVILSKVLAHPCNFGFHSMNCMVLDTFNGRKAKNLAQLAEAVAACEDDILVFEFLRPNGDGTELLTLDRLECQKAEPELLSQHLIASPCMVRGSDGELRPLEPAQRIAGCKVVERPKAHVEVPL